MMKLLSILLSFTWISLHSASNTIEFPDFPYMQKEHYLAWVKKDSSVTQSYYYFKLLTPKGDE